MRRRTTGADDLYGRLHDEQRAWWASVADRLGHAVPNQRLEALERAEPVQCHAWELPGRPSHYGLHPDANVIVHRDGTFEVVEREIGGDAGEVVSFTDAARRLKGTRDE